MNALSGVAGATEEGYTVHVAYRRANAIVEDSVFAGVFAAGKRVAARLFLFLIPSPQGCRWLASFGRRTEQWPRSQERKKKVDYKTFLMVVQLD